MIVLMEEKDGMICTVYTRRDYPDYRLNDLS